MKLKINVNNNIVVKAKVYNIMNIKYDILMITTVLGNSIVQIPVLCNKTQYKILFDCLFNDSVATKRGIDITTTATKATEYTMEFLMHPESTTGKSLEEWITEKVGYCDEKLCDEMFDLLNEDDVDTRWAVPLILPLTLSTFTLL